jgi:feruloyl esterase
MLAAYPDVFAAGAIIAGVAYGCANGVAGAFDCMGGRSSAPAGSLGRAVRAASSHSGPWPRVQVWHGSADRIVVSSNAEAIVKQWAEVQGISDRPARIDRADGHSRRVFTGADGTILIEHYEIAGMAHGVPLDPGTGEGQSGLAGAHMLDVGLSSTDRIAAFFGIADAERTAAFAPPRTHSQTGIGETMPAAARGANDRKPSGGPGEVIERALRAAGLMR